MAGQGQPEQPAVSRAYGQFQQRQKNCSLCCDGKMWECASDPAEPNGRKDC